jgi:hypothetical protein
MQELSNLEIEAVAGGYDALLDCWRWDNPFFSLYLKGWMLPNGECLGT